MKKALILVSCLALSSCADVGKTGPIAGFSAEEFKKTGTLPAARAAKPATAESQNTEGDTRFFDNILKPKKEKMAPIAGFSAEKFKETGTLPPARSSEPVPKKQQNAEPKRGFFASLFKQKNSASKKKNGEKMAPIAGFSIGNFINSRKKNEPSSSANAPGPKPKSTLSDPGDSELRLPDMLTMPDENQLRSSAGSEDEAKAPVIARPPEE